MSDPILPFEPWEAGTNQNSLPANDNSLSQQILNGLVIGTANDESSPSDGDIYIVGDTPTGAYASFDENDLVIYDSGTWYGRAPVEGIVVNVAGAFQQWNGSAYVSLPSSDTTVGLQEIYISAAAMRPSVTGGCAALAAIASAANQPDIVTLDFDQTTQEFAQFGVVLPKKWNRGTITFKPHWSHAATTVNFGVAWGLQAVAVGNDDPIAVAFGTEQTSVDTGGTTNDLYTGPSSSAITVAGTPAAGDMVFFRINRDPNNGGDTMALDARLHGITLFVTTDAGTDA